MEKKKIYLATGNKNKKREMQELLPEHTILIPSDEGISFDPDETGTTFYENSLKNLHLIKDTFQIEQKIDDYNLTEVINLCVEMFRLRASVNQSKKIKT